MLAIFLCSYNGEKYIKEQIDSILSQSFKDIHLIVSDDASSDNTVSIVEEIMRENPGKITLLQKNEGSGTGSAAKHFLSLLLDERFSSYDYYMFSDQDDIWLKDKVLISLRSIKEMEERYGLDRAILLHSDCKIVDKNLKTISDSFFKYQKLSPKRKSFNELLIQNNVTGGAMIINKALYDLVKVMPSNLMMHDHWLALIAACFGNIGFISNPLYLYRQHGDNVLGAKRASIFVEVLRRLGILYSDGKSKADMDKHSENVYKSIFLQAKEFKKVYENEMDVDKRLVLNQFIKLQDKGRIGKIIGILKGGYTFNTLYRTLGEMIYL